jgi:hypothetical protein
MEILAEGTAAETKARKAVSDGPTPAERAKAEREAKAELGPEPNPPVGARRHQDRRTVDEEGNRIPTLEERQAHYKERLLAKIDEKLAGVVKERNASKWALSLAEQEVVALDPAVRQARTKLARFMAEQHKLSWWALMWASQSGHKGWFMQLWEQDRLRSIILLAGATVFALAALRPSWNAHRVLRSRNVYDSPAGRAWLWDGPRPTTIEEWNAFSGQPNWAARVQAIGYHVDFGRTILELSAVAVVTVALVLLLKRQARNP